MTRYCERQVPARRRSANPVATVKSADVPLSPLSLTRGVSLDEAN